MKKSKIAERRKTSFFQKQPFRCTIKYTPQVSSKSGNFSFVDYENISFPQWNIKQQNQILPLIDGAAVWIPESILKPWFHIAVWFILFNATKEMIHMSKQLAKPFYWYKGISFWLYLSKLK